MLKNQSPFKSYLCTGLSALGVVSSVAFSSPTLAAIATFDSFSEGFSGTTITDGGITFFGLNPGFPEQLSDTFYIDSTTEEYLGSSFSAPNFLTVGGFASGSEPSFGAFSSAQITTGEVQNTASLEVFSLLFSPSNNILTLEAFLDGSLVASDSAALADFELIGTSDLLRNTLTISGVEFNELRLSASGPDDESIAFIGIDNVRVSVPEPVSVLGLLTFWALCATSVIKRKHKLVK
jgi:hypothetical protein